MIRRMIRAYLSLTRTERNGFFVLAILIMVLGLGRMMVPVLFRPPIPDFSAAEADFLAFRSALEEDHVPNAPPSGSDKRQKAPHPATARTNIRYFPFDSNLVSFEELLGLGLSAPVARTLVNYRNSGGEFKVKEDLLKVYGLEQEDYLRLGPYITMPPVPAIPGKPVWTLELNAADTIQLQRIYGIGRAFAARIARYRSLLGGFYDCVQLREVYGLSEQQYGEILRHAILDTTLLERMDLNTVDRQGLARHPYLTPYQADALIAYREFSGGWYNLD